MHFKRADGVLIVSGNEDDSRKLFVGEEFKHVKTAELRHLHIQKNKIW